MFIGIEARRAAAILAAMAAGCAGLLWTGPATGFPAVVAQQVLLGGGPGLLVPPMTGLVPGSADRTRSGVASGALTAFRQAGSLLGVALFRSAAAGRFYRAVGQHRNPGRQHGGRADPASLTGAWKPRPPWAPSASAERAAGTPMLAGMSDTAVVRLPDGTGLWTAVSGTGPPVACLHGGPGLWDYLAPLAALIDAEFTVVRFDQRGCGRSAGRDGPFTIAQAVDDMDRVREALGFSRWAVAGHSWGAELALRYAARYPERTAAVAYIAGVGAGNGYRDAHAAELRRRLGPDGERWAALSAVPDGERTAAEERELCLLQWRTDFSPASDAAAHALALWGSRPPGAAVNAAANRGLWGDRETEDLRLAAARVTCPVTMIFGGDDPRPWSASDSLLAALPRASRTVLGGAGHAPWAERPADTRRLLAGALAEGGGRREDRAGERGR